MQRNAMSCNAMPCNAMQCMYACMHVCVYTYMHEHDATLCFGALWDVANNLAAHTTTQYRSSAIISIISTTRVLFVLCVDLYCSRY